MENIAAFGLLRNLFSIFTMIFFACKIVKTHIILARNFKEYKTKFRNIRYIFLILILSFQTLKIAKTNIISDQNYRDNNAEFRYVVAFDYIRYVFLILRQ
jgi:hypothetical protein